MTEYHPVTNEHCDHERICFDYVEACAPCDNDECGFDTRSRPHTSTPLHSTILGLPDPEGNCKGCETGSCCEACQTWIHHHDTTIRNATLDEFMSAIEFRFDDTNKGRGVVGTIRGIKESLRTKEQP